MYFEALGQRTQPIQKTIRRGMVVLCMIAAPSLAQAAAKGDPVKGAAFFSSHCALCHSVVIDNTAHPGPLLKGVVGRKAASVPGFAYSAALKASGQTWSSANLNKFITMPSALVPGTFMPISVPDPADRLDVIAYLREQK